MDNLRGSLLMVAAMAGFAVEDVLIKQIASKLPMGEVLALIGCGGTLIFGTLTLVTRQSTAPRRWWASRSSGSRLFTSTTGVAAPRFPLSSRRLSRASARLCRVEMRLV